MIEALDVASSAAVVGAGGDLVNAEALVEGAGKFRAEFEVHCRKEG